jgi:hypothetical protein
MPDEVYKVCNVCDKNKPVSDFSVKYTKKDGSIGYNARCKKCICARVKVYREKNYDEIKERKREWWANNKGRFREERRQYNDGYVKNNIDKKRDSARKYASKNRRKHIDYVNNRYKTDPVFNLQVMVRRRI